MKLRGLIFDIDGTLIDSNDLHAQCWFEAFDHFGKHFEYDVVRQQIGKGGDVLVRELFEEFRRRGMMCAADRRGAVGRIRAPTADESRIPLR